MKTITMMGLALTLLLMTLISEASFAATEAETKTQAKKKTEVSFEDLLVQGKYHFSDEAVTTVEQDKVLDALLGVRTDFKDRIKKSSTRY